MSRYLLVVMWLSAVGCGRDGFDVYPPYGYTSDSPCALCAGWLSDDWRYRVRLTFDNSAQSTSLTDFPVLVSFSTASYPAMSPLLADLRFVDGSGTVLSHEVETSGSSANVWVRVPSIGAASTTDAIFMYFGNASAVDAQNPPAVWSNGYGAVWHLSEIPAGAGAVVRDSSVNAKNGTTVGMTPSSAVAGRIGGALTTGGAAAHIRVPSNASDVLAIQGPITLEAWAWRASDPTDWASLIHRQLGSGISDSYGIAGSIDEPSQVIAATHGLYNSLSGAISNGSWVYVVATSDVTQRAVFVNGALSFGETGSFPEITTDDNDVLIGGEENGATTAVDEGWEGSVDEARISTVRRSPDWIRAQFLSMSGGFISFGTVEALY